ncbi:hypothetical protein C8R42DRAFT_640631 [Lentinula raphanica]|nr:hypothetical protein C8R42DRAFT_640631 [Lentinula raphanica]
MTRFVFVLKLGIILAFLVSTILSPGVLAAPIPFTAKTVGLKMRDGLPTAPANVSEGLSLPTLKARYPDAGNGTGPSPSQTKHQSQETPKQPKKEAEEAKNNIGYHRRGAEALVEGVAETVTTSGSSSAMCRICSGQVAPGLATFWISWIIEELDEKYFV